MDKREQIARMAQTKEDEMLLAKIYERMTNAAARNIPAATGFLSKREQMLAAELLRGQEIRFYGGPPLADLLLSAGVSGRKLAGERGWPHCRRPRGLF